MRDLTCREFVVIFDSKTDAWTGASQAITHDMEVRYDW
jgi:hypothetical protein